jgi:hypothetical protein
MGLGEEGNDCERRIRGGVLQWKLTRDVFGGDGGGQGKMGISFFLMLMAGGGSRLRRRPEGR